MIDHNRQAIFIHIARTGGTSVETAYIGGDFWYLNANEKHIPASVAKKLYEPYWDQYYKFSIVRNPFDRFRSMWKHADHYGLYLNDAGEIELDRYLDLWGYPRVLEVNLNVRVDVTEHYRSHVDPHEGSLYLNLLREDVQVLKFEDFPSILRNLSERSGINAANIRRLEESTGGKPRLSRQAIDVIREIHDKDFDAFDYSRDYWN